VLIIQFAGLPSGLKNYGLTIVDAVTFPMMLWTKLVSGACLSPINVYMGSTAQDLLQTLSGHGTLTPIQIALMCIGLVCLVAVLLVVGYYVRREMAAMDEDYSTATGTKETECEFVDSHICIGTDEKEDTALATQPHVAAV
jgi:hypothetical protein